MVHGEVQIKDNNDNQFESLDEVSWELEGCPAFGLNRFRGCSGSSESPSVSD